MKKQQLKHGDCVILYDDKTAYIGFINEEHLYNGSKYFEFHGVAKNGKWISISQIEQWDYKIIDIQL